MGHIAHLRKQFKSINTYGYIIRLIKRKTNHYYLYENYMVLHLNNLNPLHPKMLCAKLCWNWLSGSGEEDFLISSMFAIFVIISPWKRVGPFIWNNLNPLHLNHALCIVIISPWKRVGPFIWRKLIPLNQKCFMPSLVEIGPVFLEKKVKMWKVYGQTDRQTDGRRTDNRRSEMLTIAFSSGELKKKENNKNWFISYKQYLMISALC